MLIQMGYVGWNRLCLKQSSKKIGWWEPGHAWPWMLCVGFGLQKKICSPWWVWKVVSSECHSSEVLHLIIHNFILKHILSLWSPFCTQSLFVIAESIASVEFVCFQCIYVKYLLGYCIVFRILWEGFRICPGVDVSAVEGFWIVACHG